MQDISGKTLTSVSGKTYTLTKHLDQGAQGVIYEEESGKYLIKLFLNKRSLESMLLKTKKLMRVSFPPRFIKPIDVIEIRNENGQLVLAGYVMIKVVEHISLNKLLLPPDGESLSNWYNTFSGGLKRRLYLSYQIAMNFYLLHRNNIAYCDISGNNILVAKNPKTASVCMIDIDNLYTPGYENATVSGTIRYMAPEIINSQIQPDVLTDDYSLAVIIFELLKCAHPYIGDFIENSAPEAEQLAFCGKFPYIDDPNNNENRSSSALPNEAVLNQKLIDTFFKIFVSGKKNRMERATAWEMAIKCLEASNSLMRCEHCGAWYFPNNKVGTLRYQCPWCDEENIIKSYFLVYKRYPHCDNEPICLNGKNAQSQITYILQDSENNIVPENYLKLSVTDSDVAKDTSKINVAGNLKTALRIAKIQGIWKVENTSGRELYFRKGNRGPYKIIVDKEIIIVENGDCIYSQKEEAIDNFTYEEMMAKDITPIVFLQFNFR